MRTKFDDFAWSKIERAKHGP